MIAKAKNWTFRPFSWLFAGGRRVSEREIFAFHDGERERRVDPLRALGLIEGTYPQLTMLADEIRAVEVDGDQPAIKRLVAVVHEAFGTSPFNEAHGGTTEGEALAILGQFLQYLLAVKKKRANSPMPSQPTVLSTPPVASTTSSDSASTCIKSE